MLGEIEEKTQRLVRLMNRQQVGGVVLSLQPNFSWLTAGGSNGVDTSREAGAGALLVRSDGQKFVLANRIEMPRLLGEVISEKDFQPIEFPWEEEKLPGFISNLARSLLQETTAMAADAPLDESTQVIDGAISACRYELTNEEIDRFRALGRDAGEAVGNLMKNIAPGETEKDVARRAMDSLARKDIQCVVSLVAADDRIGKYRHPLPTTKRWNKQLMLVVCARRYGLVASLTRLICIGSQPDELQKRTMAAAQVNAELFAHTRKGVTAAELYYIAAQAYAGAGFENEQLKHHQGGACGYRTRDWLAHPAATEVVETNQAFAWNPSVTGTKVEETCIAFADRLEIITASPDWPSLNVTAGEDEYLLPDILCR